MDEFQVLFGDEIELRVPLGCMLPSVSQAILGMLADLRRSEFRDFERHATGLVTPGRGAGSHAA